MKDLPTLLAIALTMASCTAVDDGSASLVFGQALTVGISVGPSPTNAGVPEIVVGVKQADIAYVPAVLSEKHKGSANPLNIASPQIIGFDRSTDGKTAPRSDALSTFGSFTSDTTISGVNLGVFFATGVAAQILAEGVVGKVKQN